MIFPKQLEKQAIQTILDFYKRLIQYKHVKFGAASSNNSPTFFKIQTYFFQFPDFLKFFIIKAKLPITARR